MNNRTPDTSPRGRSRVSRVSKLKAGAALCALLVASLLVAASLAPAPSGSATTLAPGNVTLKTINFYGLTSTETYTASIQVFASTDCSGVGGSVATVQHIDEATGHTFALGATQSALLTVSPGDSYGQSEQNGLFAGWQNGVASPVPTYLPGDGRQVCVQGVDAPGSYEYIARFAPGIEYFDSCGVERYEFRPGEAVTIKVTGGLKHAGAEPYRLQAAGGSANECTWIPEAPAYTTVHVTTDPFTYTFTLPDSDSDLPASCTSNNTTTITGNWRAVAYDVPGCGCNRADVRFQVLAGPPPAGCALDCPDDITVANDAGSCGAVVNYDAPAATPGTTVTCSHPSGSTFPVGTTAVTCTSSAGPSCDFDVTVNDTQSPTIAAPADLVVSADASCAATLVSLGTPAVGDNCPGHNVTNDAPPSFPLGTTTVTWTVNDAHGHTATDTQTVTVIDDTPPTISGASANPSSLWPSNHKMRDVTLSYSASDDCGVVNCVVSGVTSNEPVDGGGDGNTAPDWQIVNSHLVRLRAERAGGGAGRVYTITVTCTDGAGNTSSRNVTVNVPHNK